jgi:hypothetical protein
MSNFPDPTADLYSAMDRAKLTGANFLQSKVGMSKLVIQARTALAIDLKRYIESRERIAYEKGLIDKGGA